MSAIAIAILAFTMSIDATVAALSRGAALQNARLKQALQTGIVFGIVETITPLVGWVAGIAASQAIAAWDHWVGFVLLALVGGHMIVSAFKPDEDDAPPRSSSPLLLMATAIGTSIDAMIVGVSLAFLEVNIIVVAAAIGCATFVMSTLGVLAGCVVGARVGRMAEAVGGIVLIGLGVSILIQHLQPGM